MKYLPVVVAWFGFALVMAASTFAMSPGVTILHSKDLVNWETVGAAVPDLSALGPNLNWGRMARYDVNSFHYECKNK